MPKNVQTTAQLQSNPSKVILKILQARLQQYVNWELPDVQAGFRKGKGPEIKWPTSTGSSKKQESSRKTSTYSFDYTKLFDCVDHNKLWKSLQEMGMPDHITCLREICMQVKKQQLELDMEQQTGSK